MSGENNCERRNYNMALRLAGAYAICPDKIAVADKEVKYSYADFYKAAGAVASYLLSRTGGKSVCVGVIAERCADVIPVFYGIIWAGGYYLPIDPGVPKDKKKNIVNDSGTKFVFGFGDEGRIEGTEYINAEKILKSGAEPPKIISAEFDTPLYAVYTSGSTGKPKGVLKSHGAMSIFLDGFLSEVDVEENEIIGNQTPFCFDASAKDIYLSVEKRATLEVLDHSLFVLPVNLIRYLNERKVTYISWVPSALSVVTKLNTFIEVKPEYLRKVLFVGEVFPVKQLNKWIDALPGVEFYNLYGQSEIAGVAFIYKIESRVPERENLPIGKPLCHCRGFIERDGSVIEKTGEPGELCLISKSLALGYINDVERTEDRFRYTREGERYFRTGDIVSYDKNRLLVFSGREDDMVKHMGYRIELGEVENAALKIDRIKDVCCKFDSTRDRIILFCVCEDKEITSAEIIARLKERLSSYMLPTRVIIIDEMPLNANGKKDRVKLDDYYYGGSNGRTS